MPRARHQLYKHNPSTFFSLFLSNDQVYFGRIVEETSDTIVLKDVYYLKTTSSDLTTQTNLNEGTVSAKLSLVKLGKELHRPKDQIFINRQHVIYYEEMGDESPIIENILNSRKQKL